MFAALLTSSALLVATERTADPSVLFVPLEARDGVSVDLAEQVTAALVVEAGRRPGMRVVSLREVQGTMTQEEIRQVAGCDAAGCAAEIAGSLNTDEIVFGSVGRVGEAYFLALSRVSADDAAVIARVGDRVGASEDALMDHAPTAIQALFADRPLGTTTGGAARALVAAGPRRVLPLVMRVGAGALFASALGAAGVGAGGLGIGAGAFAFDLAQGFRPFDPAHSRHAFTFLQALVLQAAVVVGSGLLLLALAVAGGGALAVAGSFAVAP